MCGRFCCALNPESVKNKLYDDNICKQKDIDWIDKDKYSASYNICPTRYIATMYQDRTRKEVLQSMQWGFVPSWSKNVSMAKPINARLETLQEKSLFDSAKNHKRCVVIAEGFYEWKSSNKQPYYIKRKDGQLMLFAGLYDTNMLIGDNLTTCVIITTHSSDFFTSFHDRMPVILDRQNVDRWLDNGSVWSKSVVDLLKPFEGLLECYQVSDKVGQVNNDTPDLIVPTDSKKSSISYFLKYEDPKSKFDTFDKKDKESSSKKRRASSIVQELNKRKKKSPKNTVITNFFTKK